MKRRNLEEVCCATNNSRIRLSTFGAADLSPSLLPGGVGYWGSPADDLHGRPDRCGGRGESCCKIWPTTGQGEDERSRGVPAAELRGETVQPGRTETPNARKTEQTLHRADHRRHLIGGPRPLADTPLPVRRGLSEPRYLRYLSYLSQRHVTVALVVLLTLIAGACGAGQQSTPPETTLAVYEAAGEGDLELLEGFYSEDLSEGMEGPIGEAIGGSPGMADHLARGGAIEEIRVEDVETSGDLAQVTVFIRYDEDALEERNAGDTFGEDNPVTQTLPLINEEGSWKVSADYLRGV